MTFELIIEDNTIRNKAYFIRKHMSFKLIQLNSVRSKIFINQLLNGKVT